MTRPCSARQILLERVVGREKESGYKQMIYVPRLYHYLYQPGVFPEKTAEGGSLSSPSEASAWIDARRVARQLARLQPGRAARGGAAG